MKHIPGFRTSVKWKKIIASIYYLMALTGLKEGISYFITLFVLPFIFFSIAEVFKASKLSKREIKNKKDSRAKVNLALFKSFGFLMIFVVALVSMPSSKSNSLASNNTKGTKTTQVSEEKEKNDEGTTNNEVAATKEESSKSVAKSTVKVQGKLKVHYIDVGQADSILIQQNEHNMLIDAGNNGDSSLVVNYLKKQGVSKLDYVIGTHPHEDHIGGLDVVIKSFDIGKVLMPKKTSTTRTFKDVINAIKSKGLKITAPIPNTNYDLGEAKWTILSPAKNKDYEDVNNYSIVCKLKYGNTSFIFTGDAEAISEMEMVKAGYDLKADVLKVGHHGSRSSTCANFLKAVNPKYAIISCGKDNKYGHPHKSTMDRLKSKGIPVYRTDECGTIVCTSDGTKVTFDKKPGDYTYKGTGTSTTVNKSTSSSKTVGKHHTKVSTKNNTVSKPTVKQYINAQGTGLIKGSKSKIYHVPGSTYYNRTKNVVRWFKTVEEAKKAGYRAPKR